MKKLIIFMIIIFSFCFVKVNGVTTDNYITINNTRMYGTNTIYTAGGNQSVKIVRNGSVDKSVPLYGFVAICSALGSNTDHYITQWSSQLADEMNIINSTDGCYLPDTTYYRDTSRIIYITFRLPMSAYDCGSGSGVCQLTSDIDLNFVQPNSNVYSLINFGLGNEAFTFPDAINVQVNQNQQIINGQQDIINSQNSNTNSIINNQNTTTNSIINNQNQNTKDMIDSQKACKILSYNKNNINNFELGQLNSNGLVTSAVVLSVSPFLQVDNNTKFYNSGSWPNSLTNEYFCLYTENKSLISCYRFSDYYSSNHFNFENFDNAKYLRFTIWNQSNNNGTLYVKTCKDGNQALNDSINELNDNINDDNIDSPNSAISNLNQYLATNSTISNLITLPITLFQKVLTSLNGTCSSYDLGEYKGTHIILPCIEISHYIGSTLFNVIDVLISGLLIYKMSRKFIAVFHNMSSMKEGDVISD